MSRDRNLYNNLITSLFPSIHGNNEVKRGILLMLFGGVAKTTIEGRCSSYIHLLQSFIHSACTALK